MTNATTTVPSIELAHETTMSPTDIGIVVGGLLLALAILFRRRLFGRNRATAGPACSGCGGCSGSCPTARHDFLAPPKGKG